MNLETAKQIFTAGWNNRWTKPNPYKAKGQNKEADIFALGEEAAVFRSDLEKEFANWRENNGFPLSYRERAEQNKRLIPKEFWDMMESQAYDRGHSAGQEETDMILMNIVDDFVGALGKYAIRTGKTLV